MLYADINGINVEIYNSASVVFVFCRFNGGGKPRVSRFCCKYSCIIMSVVALLLFGGSLRQGNENFSHLTVGVFVDSDFLLDKHIGL